MTVLYKELIGEVILFSEVFDLNTLMTAIRDMSMTKFIIEDEPLFRGLLSPQRSLPRNWTRTDPPHNALRESHRVLTRALVVENIRGNEQNRSAPRNKGCTANINGRRGTGSDKFVIIYVISQGSTRSTRRPPLFRSSTVSLIQQISMIGSGVSSERLSRTSTSQQIRTTRDTSS